MTVATNDICSQIEALRRLSETALSPLRDAAGRQREAQNIVLWAMQIARDICGPEIAREAYGACKLAGDRAQALEALRQRLYPLSFFYVQVDNDIANFDAIDKELSCLVGGDQPMLFAQITSKKAFRRMQMAKLDALRWEAYLNGRGIGTEARHKAVAIAFRASSWDSIRRRWTELAVQAFGQDRVESRLEKDRQDGAQGLRRWSMNRDEDWESALSRSGERYWALKQAFR